MQLNFECVVYVKKIKFLRARAYKSSRSSYANAILSKGNKICLEGNEFTTQQILLKSYGVKKSIW